MSKYSFANTIAALEEFEDEVNSEIAAPAPTDGDFGDTTAGVDFIQESDDIDGDLESLTKAAQGLEDIINLVSDAPGEDAAPLEPYVERTVNVALESNELVSATGGAVALTGDKGGNPDEKSKGKVLEKIKAFAAKVWEMLRNLGKSVAKWIGETWAKFTDRIVKNAALAQKILDNLSTLNTKAGVKITDKDLLGKIATYGNVEVGDVMIAVSEFATDQGGKAAEELTKECRTCIDVVASGGSSADGVMERFTEALAKAAGSYHDKAKPEQAQAVGAAGSTETLLTKPFFGGYRGWVTVPENADALQYWKHGVTKVDEVKPQASIDAPDANEIKAIAEYVVSLGALVKTYQGNIKRLDELNKTLDQAASKSKAGKSDSAQLKQMQAVVPRIIKGPQVAAYAYATSASTIALQYCRAGIEAHRAGGEKPAEGADKSKE